MLLKIDLQEVAGQNITASVTRIGSSGVVLQLELRAQKEATILLPVPVAALSPGDYQVTIRSGACIRSNARRGTSPASRGGCWATTTREFRFAIVNLRELDAVPLLAKGSPERALEVVLPRIRKLRGAEQELAAGALTLLSGILGIRKGLEQGLEQGREQGKQELLRDPFAAKFGPLPEWSSQRLKSASAEELKSWAGRIFTSPSLEDLLR